MQREAALAVRDQLQDQLGGMLRSTDTPRSASPSLGVWMSDKDDEFQGRYGVSILVPEGEEKRFRGWTQHAIATAESAGGYASVEVTSPFRVYGCPATGHLAPGCSISAGNGIFAGTLGSFVRRGETLAVLSNAHVLAPDPTTAPANDIVAYHPGLLDQPPSSAPFGSLMDFQPLAPDGPENDVDAAIAVYAPDDPDKITIDWPQPAQPGYVRGATDDPNPDEDQEKVGRTTGRTSGRLTRFGHLAWVDYGEFGMMLFRDCFVFEGPDGPFSAAGDSGSLIYGQESRLASALLFAGADSGGRFNTGITLANPIMKVLDRLNVELVGEGGAS